jgi:hypothetical protein
MAYDIPVGAEVANPSRFLRRRGVRVNLSCWLIPEANVPYHLINEMTEAGCTVRVVRFADEEAANIAEWARQAIVDEVARRLRRARQSIEQADAQAAADDVPADERARQYRRRALAAERRARRMLEALAEGARAFGLDTSGLTITAASRALDRVHAGVEARCLAYAEGAREAGRRGRPDMARAAREDVADPGILADLIEERGGNHEQLRAAFAAPPE